MTRRRTFLAALSPLAILIAFLIGAAAARADLVPPALGWEQIEAVGAPVTLPQDDPPALVTFQIIGNLPHAAAMERAVEWQVNVQARRYYAIPEIQFGPVGLPVYVEPTIAELQQECGAGAGGCHTLLGATNEMTANADDWSPVIFVTPQYEVSVALSHEILETMGDPNTWGSELCDPVFDITYKIAGVSVSDFVLPAYFNHTPGKLDWLGQLPRPDAPPAHHEHRRARHHHRRHRQPSSGQAGGKG